ncbi:MAG: XdhC family protein [Defluviicoccus sp.]|nr:XdhC family protein [Defluviicoccus sp.]MDE0279011.1 XdhC family protein [Defluviicoccus sp.]
MKQQILKRVLADREAKRQFALVTRLETGEQSILYLDGADEGEVEIDSALRSTVEDAIRDDRSGTVAGAGGDMFVEVFNPPLRLLIVGAVHIAQPLARMASVAGYDVTVIDPRGSFATDDRFPGVTLVNEWPDEAMPPLDPDRRTAVVTLTHDPKIDDPALAAVLRSDAFYIGALGSRKTHAARVERLTESGFGADEIGRIHGPVGLSLGAVSPAEIAVSILAQVTRTLHDKERVAA